MLYEAPRPRPAAWALLAVMLLALPIWWRFLRVPQSSADTLAQQAVAALADRLPRAPSAADGDVWITLPNGERWIVAFRRFDSTTRLPDLSGQTLPTTPGEAVGDTGAVLPLAEAKIGHENDLRLRHAPTLSAYQIDAILSSYASPATGQGITFYNRGVERGIDPAYAVAFFIHESSAGSDPNWAGLRADGSTNYNMGNISCAGYPTCEGIWRSYGSWDEGISDWYRLIDEEYMGWRGMETAAEVLPIYAPRNDGNDPDGYARSLGRMVAGWRQAQLDAQEALPEPPPEVQAEEPPAEAPAPPASFIPQPSSFLGQSSPIPIVGSDYAFNVRAALDANGGQLWNVQIAPGATWSFNAAVGDPDAIRYTTVGGVPGGGWCNLAARYVEAVRPILPPEAVRFINHVDSNGIALDVAYENSVSIWNVGGEPGFDGGRQDLMLTNTTGRVLLLHAVETGDGTTVVVQASLAS